MWGEIITYYSRSRVSEFSQPTGKYPIGEKAQGESIRFSQWRRVSTSLLGTVSSSLIREEYLTFAFGGILNFSMEAVSDVVMGIVQYMYIVYVHTNRCTYMYSCLHVTSALF
jgi:hypothetical protein